MQPIARAPVHVQTEADQRHQHRRQYRQAPAQPGTARRIAVFGIVEQFACRVRTTGLQLLVGQGASVPLSGQLSQALLETNGLKRHIERGSVFFSLCATTAQQRKQEESQGHQRQQAGADP